MPRGWPASSFAGKTSSSSPPKFKHRSIMSPAPFPATPLTATINFTLPDDRLPPGLDPVLFPFDQSKQRPFEAVELPIFNLRPELEGLPVPAPVQLDERGFAVLRHESCTIGGSVGTAEGIAAYLEEVTTQAFHSANEGKELTSAAVSSSTS